MAGKPRIFYGWIIAFLALLTLTTYGLFYSYSVFLVPLETQFHTTRAAISAVYTIYMGVYSTCAIPMGWLSDKYGPRKTLLLAAILIGSGAAAITYSWPLRSKSRASLAITKSPGA